MSMREDFEAAIEGSGLEAEDENFLGETQQEVEIPEDSLSADDGETDESKSPELGAIDAEKPNINDKGTDNEAKAADNEHDSLKAPVDWSPKQRESWSKIPRPIQDKIVARENEMATAMQGTAEARKTHDAITQLGNSYASIIAAEGVSSPMEAVKGLFNTVAELRMGTPAQKAAKIAQLINHYGVDIQALDSVLVGQAPQENPNAQFEQMLDKRMAPINQVMERLNSMQQQKSQQTQHAANNAVVAFGDQAEFLSDVRMDMADLIDMAAKQGRNLTLQEAYDRACTLNPEINSVLEERKRHEQITGGRNTMAAKRSAASTLNGRQTGSGGGGGAMSLRDTIASAWDDNG